MVDTLNEFIKSNPDPRELKRALAVKMFLENYKHREIQTILGISSGFISKWTKIYEKSGIDGLKLGYLGSNGYLEPTFSRLFKTKNNIAEKRNQGTAKSNSVYA